MQRDDPKNAAVEDDAERLEEKFGPAADVYADTRREAAEIAGDEASGDHWKEVAAEVRDEDQ